MKVGPSPRHWPMMLGVGLARLAVKLPYSLLIPLGALLGFCLGRVQGARRLVAQTNIAACFPQLDQGQQKRLLNENLRATGIGLVEAGLAYWARDQRLRKRVEVEGLDHLEDALSAGCGALVLMAHYTTVELACRLLNLVADPPVWLLGRRHNQAWLAAHIDRARRAHCGRVLEKKDIKGVMGALKQGQALFYAPDQNFSYQSVFAPFFGHPAATVTATAELAARTGCRIVPLWCHRMGGHYRLVLEAAWEDFPQGDALVDALRVNRWVEDHVRINPEQYLWVHRRFKTRPAGEPPFYPVQAMRRKDRPLD